MIIDSIYLRNLQAAICSYYDFDQPSVKLPELAFITDVTIGDGEAVPPNTTFTKTWRVANSGNKNNHNIYCSRYFAEDVLCKKFHISSVKIACRYFLSEFMLP